MSAYFSCESIPCYVQYTYSHMNKLVKLWRDIKQEILLGQKLKTFVLRPEGLYSKHKTILHRCPHAQTHEYYFRGLKESYRVRILRKDYPGSFRQVQSNLKVFIQWRQKVIHKRAAGVMLMILKIEDVVTAKELSVCNLCKWKIKHLFLAVVSSSSTWEADQPTTIFVSAQPSQKNINI